MRDEQMVRVLLSSKRISPNNRLLLADYDKQLRAGFLANQERNFIRALFAWHEAQAVEAEGEAGEAGAMAREAASISTVHTLKMRLSEAQGRLSALERQHDADLKRIALLEEALHKAKAEGSEAQAAGDDRFKHAKRAFARLFHPDNRHGSDTEHRVRADMFKEFWGELEKIERGG
jgi:hypothetical protein